MDQINLTDAGCVTSVALSPIETKLIEAIYHRINAECMAQQKLLDEYRHSIISEMAAKSELQASIRAIADAAGIDADAQLIFDLPKMTISVKQP